MGRWASIPCCLRCWSEREGDRKPVRLVAPDNETCGFCGHKTNAGVYVREEVAKAPHHEDH